MSSVIFRPLAALLILLAPNVLSHRLNYAQTEIRWQPDSRVLEVTHSVHLDDALVLLAQLGAPNGELTLPTAARLMVYIESRFNLATVSGPITLEPAGAHVEGDYLYAYQTSIPLALPAFLNIEHQLLTDLFDQQINQVNWYIGEQVRSVQFDRDTQPQQLGAQTE